MLNMPRRKSNRRRSVGRKKETGDLVFISGLKRNGHRKKKTMRRRPGLDRQTE